MKKLPRRFFLLLAIYGLLLTVVFAQNKELTINGDQVSYDQAHNLVEGAGSVEVVYRGSQLHAQHVVYNTKTDLVQAEGGFTLRYNGTSLEGAALVYNFISREGEAREINFTYEGIEVAGDQLEISPDRLDLKNVSFSTCNLHPPHYRVTAKELTLYPQYGWLAASWGWFWFNNFPLVPVPTYIYDLHAEPAKSKKRSQVPFPDVGSNDQDGFYINETLAWHVRRELSGTYTISYAGKKGLGGGLEADYVINDDSQGNARFYGNAGDGYWGGLTHNLYFGGRVTSEARIPFAFFILPEYRQHELALTLSHRERLNYQRVSFLPKLIIQSNDTQLFHSAAKYDLEIGAARVVEENNIALQEGIGKITLFWDFPGIEYGKFSPSLIWDSLFYSNGTRWLKPAVNLEYKKILPGRASFNLGYLHYLRISGQSPFNFEMYRFRPADKLASDLLFMLQETGVGIHASYFLDNWSPEDIDYTLSFRMHCYNLTLQYRSLRGEFTMGFNLAGRQ